MFQRKSKSPQPSAEFVCLLTEHQADLWAYIIAQLPGCQDVADILQKANLALWTKQDQFELGTNFKAWAFRVARFEVLAYLKKSKRGSWLVFREELAETIASESADEMDSSMERLPYLDACMQQLRPEDQQLLKHRYQANAPLEDYAQKTGRSVSSLSVTLYRLRAALRSCIKEKLQEERGNA